MEQYKTSFQHEGKYYEAVAKNYKIFCPDADFSLTIYEVENEELNEIYINPHNIYNLRDCSTTIRTQLNCKGKRIKWIEQ
ncbi:hypothetical protein CUU60_24380 [Paenibacillus polymyxa ATCC 842]|uniref:Uncharacterized protein n=1 Tax=Paenibacillus polymyxa TaxID=1406 RepID=A0A378XXL5_PAEPO|nr:hypothetical protein [Paenibacillus polymyxa]UOD88149.1 hypothetical protein CUU60_24380 [Paenibacillus polymyxa ATCC 842]SUA68408.1 Uncharacterised protein [Paenibacillus polymyxa]